VRRLARENGIPVHAKKDSTGICFIGERRFADFLRRYLPAQHGEMRSITGEVLGEHHGLMYYTLGQRQGLGIGGRRGHDEVPWYVVDKDLGNNVLVVAQGQDNVALFSRGLLAEQAHWINDTPTLPARMKAKVRYRQADQDCRVDALPDGDLQVSFDIPQRAVTPGQYVVFYDNECCLGGAVISERLA
jgi:tRNA-specific 2-thiouridylase